MIDLDSIRSFLAWDLTPEIGHIYKPEARAILMREYLISLVVAVEHHERRLFLIRSLVAHYRAAALGAETDSERETWIIAAEQLDAALSQELQP